MYISYVEIKNFRNFKHLQISLQPYAVIVGANKAGKSNFIEAIKLAISPSITRNEETLNETDFWIGKTTPDEKPNREISIVVEITLEDVEIVYFTAALIKNNIARFEYIFRQKDLIDEEVVGEETEETEEVNTEVELESNNQGAVFESFWKMGKDRKSNVNSDWIKKRFSFEVLDALRDAEASLTRWQRSPLKTLLKNNTQNYDINKLIKSIEEQASDLKTSQLSGILGLVDNVNTRGKDMVGSVFSIDADLDLNMFPKGAEDLLRLFEIYVDTNRPVSRTSLGTQNVLLISLLLEEMQNRHQNNAQHLMLALEEPEAHIHPHLQRSIFSYFRDNLKFVKSVLITTHSAQIASVSPIKSIVMIRNSEKDGSKAAFLQEDLPQNEIEDIERYLDISRAELVFARGVIFVEGVAEEYLVPAFAKSKGINLDHYGISVISVNSTNFAPFIKLVSPQNFDIPFAVLTDGDPYVRNNFKGINRGKELAKLILGDVDTTNLSVQDLANIGLFIGKYTIEVDLIPNHKAQLASIFFSFLSEDIKYRNRIYNRFMRTINQLETSFTSLSKTEIASYIRQIEYRATKGQFAQRLAPLVEKSNEQYCPQYIQDCFTYLVQKLETSQTLDLTTENSIS